MHIGSLLFIGHPAEINRRTFERGYCWGELAGTCSPTVDTGTPPIPKGGQKGLPHQVVWGVRW